MAAEVRPHDIVSVGIPGAMIYAEVKGKAARRGSIVTRDLQAPHQERIVAKATLVGHWRKVK